MVNFTDHAVVPSELVSLTDNVRRLTAPNPSVMTGAGTNTYIIGRTDFAVIDPGPAIESHIQAILDACNGRLRWILTTHTHRDHSPAAQRLVELTGAKLLGNRLLVDDGFQDIHFNPVGGFSHNDTLVSDEFTLRAICTPGHVDNHVCYLLEDLGLLLAGDHIMQGSTVVIIPPHGNMKAYIESLQTLLTYPLKMIGPAHGQLISDPLADIQRLINHRLGREAKVLSVLAQRGAGSLEQLTASVYDDVDAALHPVAQYSLWAHLLKLEQEQRAQCCDEQWSLLI